VDIHVVQQCSHEYCVACALLHIPL